MATYSDFEKKQILSYPIEDLMAHLGKDCSHHGEMYRSPFREEATPSFHISREKNLWMDFGTGEGGNIIPLAQRLLGLGGPETWDYLAGLALGNGPAPERPECGAVRREEPGIIVRSCMEIRSGRLIRYAEGRRIPSDILKTYCRQVVYRTGGCPAAHTAIGFPNSRGGWVLRSADEGPFSKMTSASACTFIGPSGAFVDTPTHDMVEIFEGFFDFMSWLVISGRKYPECDAVVLNSVSNLQGAMDFIAAHQHISCWFDSDDAGRKAYAALSRRFPKASCNFAVLEGNSCKDVNELLVRKRG